MVRQLQKDSSNVTAAVTASSASKLTTNTGKWSTFFILFYVTQVNRSFNATFCFHWFVLFTLQLGVTEQQQPINV